MDGRLRFGGQVERLDVIRCGFEPVLAEWFGINEGIWG